MHEKPQQNAYRTCILKDRVKESEKENLITGKVYLIWLYQSYLTFFLQKLDLFLINLSDQYCLTQAALCICKLVAVLLFICGVPDPRSYGTVMGFEKLPYRVTANAGSMEQLSEMINMGIANFSAPPQKKKKKVMFLK